MNIINEIVSFLGITIELFIEMAPYMVLGIVFTGVLHILLTKDFVAKQIGKSDVWSIVKASLFGVPLPLCSCGVIPTAVFMRDSGASRASTVSFLTSTPQTGIDSIIATYGILGWVFAVFRPFAALLMGLFGGLATMFTTKEKSLATHAVNGKAQVANDKFISLDTFKPKSKADAPPEMTFAGKVKKMWHYATVEFLDNIALHFVVGVIIAGLISYFVPPQMISDTPFTSGILGMLLMIVIGAPMYICATASIPIAAALMLKGVSPGVAFVFLAVGPATNAASLSMLYKTIGRTATATYLASMAVSAIAMGLLLDFIFEAFSLEANIITAHDHSGLIPHWLSLPLAILFFIFLIFSILRKNFGLDVRRLFMKDEHKNRTIIGYDKLPIEGMTCDGCRASVEGAVKKMNISDYEVSLDDKALFIKGDYDLEKLKAEIEDRGYKVRV